MSVFALFENGTAKVVKIYVHEGEERQEKKVQVDINGADEYNKDVFQSAKSGIEMSVTVLYREIRSKYVAFPTGFGNDVTGKSGGLAFALAFVEKLVNENLLNHNTSLPEKIAATGIINDRGDVEKVCCIEEKVLAAVREKCHMMFYPKDNEDEVACLLKNRDEIKILCQNDLDVLKAFDKIKLYPVSSLEDSLGILGITPFRKSYREVHRHFRIPTILLLSAAIIIFTCFAVQKLLIKPGSTLSATSSTIGAWHENVDKKYNTISESDNETHTPAATDKEKSIMQTGKKIKETNQKLILNGEPKYNSTYQANPTTTFKPAWLTSTIAEGSSVPEYTFLSGRYIKEMKEKIWIFVSKYNETLKSYGNYHPQSMNPNLGEETAMVNGVWETGIHIGNHEDAGKKFRITLATANQEAHSIIIKKLCADAFNNNYTGFEFLPEGLKEIQHIEIIRSPEKVGRIPKLPETGHPGIISLDNGVPEGSTVSQYITLKGGYSSNIGNKKIWALVYSPNCKWFPQSMDISRDLHTKMESDKWEVPVRFGDAANNSTDPYYVAVVLADNNADNFFRSIQKKWYNNNSYPGLYTVELPVGISKKIGFGVKRKPVSFSNIKNGDAVERNIVIQGECPEVFWGKPWIFVRPKGFNYFPQSVNPDKPMQIINGKFESIVGVGSENDKVNSFDIIFARVDDTADKHIINMLNKGIFSGYETLPSGTVIDLSVSVYRK